MKRRDLACISHPGDMHRATKEQACQDQDEQKAASVCFLGGGGPGGETLQGGPVFSLPWVRIKNIFILLFTQKCPFFFSMRNSHICF